jgi:hypothetical protein
VLATVFIALFYLNYAPGIIDALANLFAVQYFPQHSRTVGGAEVLGFVAIAVVLKDLKTDRVLRWWDFLAIFGAAIASLYPSPELRAIAVTCLGLSFVRRSDKRIASLGQLCIGLAWIDFWAAIVLGLVAQWLLPLETQLAYLPLSLSGSGAFSLDGIIISNSNGHAIEVLEPCSAFHNTITIGFIWLSLLKIQKLEVSPRHFYILAISLAAVVVLNTARISVMALSESQYIFWHLGPGLWIVKVTMLSVVLGLFCFDFETSPKQMVAS